ncbi:MAG: magnesium/cobalt transporter CorA [candidate division NC10 bacterium]|nr:magnesium/cobalt transporter CorA [candidate division NC10 bacterium]
MPRLTQQRSKKAGLPPGSLVYIGEKKAEEAKITILAYDEAHVEEGQAQTIQECFSFRDRPVVTWINIDGIHDTKVLEMLGDRYGFHPLMLEDILNTDQRPKMEDYGDYLYVVLKMLRLDEDSRRIGSAQVSLILGSHFVISFQEREEEVFEAIRSRIRNGKGRIRKMGADYLAYSLIDAVVDQYFMLLEKLREEIELLEDQLIAHPTPDTLQTLHDLKREMLLLRKSVWPLREAISGLERTGSPLIQQSTAIYLRDVYDHTIQVIDTIETFRDMLSGMLDIYLSSISNKMNEVMKVLTIIATLFMPLTFLAGIYGMNFRYMPELEARWGYPAVLLLMLAAVVLMLFYFKRKRWL